LEWATPVPVVADYDGWVRLESRNATLWLPPGFEVLDLGGFADLMAMMAYAMTDAMSQMASSIAPPAPGEPVPTLVSLEELQAAFVFDFVLAADETEQAALFLVGEPPNPEIDLGLAIQGVLDGFKNEFTVDSQHAITGRSFPMARLVLSTVSEDDASPLKNLVYVFVRDGRAWSLDYGAPAERFSSLLPAFEKSAASFELIE
jgi:hypothetical protein